MRKTIYQILLLFIFFIATIQCSAQAEEGADDQSMEDKILAAFLFENGFINTGTFYWSGTAAVNKCTGTSGIADAMCGTIIADADAIQQQKQNKNLYLVLTNIKGPLINGELVLFAPHFNAITFGYEYAMSGNLLDTSKGNNNILGGMTLSQSSVLRNDNTGYDINISNYRTEEINNKQIGSLTATLSNAAVDGDVILEYNLSLNNGL